MKFGLQHCCENMRTFLIYASIVAVILYFVLSYVIHWAYLGILLSVCFTIVNVVAVYLSWYYFNNTKNFEDEGNTMMIGAYRFLGEDLTHIFIFLFRVGINIVLIYSIFSGYMPPSMEYAVGSYIAYPVLFIYLFMTCVYGAEMLCNIYSNISSLNDYIENPKYVSISNEKSTICETYGMFCDDGPQMEHEAKEWKELQNKLDKISFVFQK